MVSSIELMFEMVNCCKLILLGRISVLLWLVFSSIHDLLDDLLDAHYVKLFFLLVSGNFLSQTANDALVFLYFTLHL